MFQILIVGGDNTECAFFIETFQHSFGYGSANLWLCTSAELINEDEAAFVTAFHHCFHVGKVRGIGTQIVFNALFVAYVYKDTAK